MCALHALTKEGRRTYHKRGHLQNKADHMELHSMLFNRNTVVMPKPKIFKGKTYLTDGIRNQVWPQYSLSKKERERGTNSHGHWH